MTDLPAALEEIRENFAARSKNAQGLGADPADFRRLLAAVEAVLKLTGEWETKGGRLYGFDDRASRTFDECAEGLREAITAALTGEEADRG